MIWWLPEHHYDNVPSMHFGLFHLRSFSDPLTALDAALRVHPPPQDGVLVLPETIDIETSYYALPHKPLTVARFNGYSSHLAALSASRRLWIIAGLRSGPVRQPRNSTFLFAPSGERTHLHDKGCDLLPNNPARLPHGVRVGSLICGDCDTPRIVQELLRREPNVIMVSAASGSMNLDRLCETVFKGHAVVIANSHKRSLIYDAEGVLRDEEEKTPDRVCFVEL